VVRGSPVPSGMSLSAQPAVAASKMPTHAALMGADSVK